MIAIKIFKYLRNQQLMEQNDESFQITFLQIDM
jgi:hypothetical protein